MFPGPTCLICKSTLTCNCQKQLARFAQIVLQANARVSTEEVTSDTHQASAAHIDKADGWLATPISTTVILDRLQDHGLTVRPARLKKEGWCLEVGGSQTGIAFKLGHMNAVQVQRLIMRPSAYASFPEYLDTLAKALTWDQIENLKLTRIDFAVDYPMAFQTLLRGLDVSDKHDRIEFQNKGKQRNGIQVGSGSEKIVAYDKALKSNLPAPLSRIEVQLSGAKLPTRGLLELGEVLRSSDYDPFRTVTVSDAQVRSVALGLTEIQLARAAELNVMLKHEGLLSTRRRLNSHGNFKRDYGNLLEIRPWVDQPTEAFRRLLPEFLNARKAKGTDDARNFWTPERDNP